MEISFETRIILSAFACLTALEVILLLRFLASRRRIAGLYDRVCAQEQALSGEISRIRASIEHTLLEISASQNRLQMEGIQRLSVQTEQTRSLVIQELICQFGEARERQQQQSVAFTDQMRSGIDALRQENETRLEKIRETVEEKLQTTLENRLGESFRLVSDRLELVHKGLGEMQALAAGVGDLKRVLTNVRIRGTFGETQLSALLEQVLTPGQYETNCAPIPGRGERVEFALKLPGRDEEGSTVLLPIDAKFPQEDYTRLLDACEAGDAPGVEAARKALRSRMLAEAERIRSKYISPPHTTDFALMFVPTEGLYAESLRIPGLAETLQSRHQVVLVGPHTLYALLNSLQMGFRTLAIQKRSGEVWKILAAVKTEFGKFGDSLQAVGKKLQEASSKIEESARRSRAVEKTLREVEAAPPGDASRVIREIGSSEDLSESRNPDAPTAPELI